MAEFKELKRRIPDESAKLLNLIIIAETLWL